jgi:hypothetical protein
MGDAMPHPASDPRRVLISGLILTALLVVIFLGVSTFVLMAVR